MGIQVLRAREASCVCVRVRLGKLPWAATVSSRQQTVWRRRRLDDEGRPAALGRWAWCEGTGAEVCRATCTGQARLSIEELHACMPVEAVCYVGVNSNDSCGRGDAAEEAGLGYEPGGCRGLASERGTYETRTRTHTLCYMSAGWCGPWSTAVVAQGTEGA